MAITVGVLEVKPKDGSHGALDKAHPADNALVNLTTRTNGIFMDPGLMALALLAVLYYRSQRKKQAT